MIRACEFLWLCLLLWSVQAQAQEKIGLVLSGGGAKGMAHLGVIKALEEHNIPIDYLTGTSMGAVIGSFYASGYSLEEMDSIARSAEFQNWIKGRATETLDFNSIQKMDDPSWVSVDLAVDSSFQTSFMPNLASDVAINFALMELLIQASTKANQQFDNLMVPLRVIAADVFTQKEIIIEGSPLHRAVRASMTVPFFFRPIRVGNMLLFDGGLYDNFPVDIMEKQFNPDYIIGSNVAGTKFKDYPHHLDDQKLLAQDMIYIFLDKTTEDKLDGKGYYLQPNLEGYSALDFDKVGAMIDSGYQAGLRAIPQLSRAISRRVSQEEMAAKRQAFRKDFPPLRIDDVIVKGYNRDQSAYLSKLLNSYSKAGASIEDVKAAYYQLLANDIFKEIYPDLIYDTENNAFDFEISGQPKDRIRAQVGGNVGSKRVSALYFGLSYSRLQRNLNTYGFNLYTGRFYQSVHAYVNSTFSPNSLAFVEPFFTFNNWDYLNSTNVIFGNAPIGVLNQIDRAFGVTGGRAINANTRIKAQVAYFSNFDRFGNQLREVTTDTLDAFRINGAKIGLGFSQNTLNRKQYASKGRKIEGRLMAFSGRENYEPGQANNPENPAISFSRSWVQASMLSEGYKEVSPKLSLGYLAHWVHSTQPAFHNYVSSLANTPAFNPFQDSRTLLLVNFRAPAFVAGGFKAVANLRKNLDFRLEANAFYGYRALEPLADNRAAIGSGGGDVSIAAAGTLVFHGPIGPIALSYNHYDDPFNQRGLFLHVGYILFNRRSFEF